MHAATALAVIGLLVCLYFSRCKQYGPIVHVNMLGQHVIILSTAEVAHDLLAKRVSIFSDRPRLFLATELALKGFNLLMMNYTAQFRVHQRLQATVLNASPTTSYAPIRALEARQLLHDLLNNASSPTGTEVHLYIQRAIASLIHALLYGFRIRDPNDPVLRKVIDLNIEFSEFVQVGKHIVDQFPVLNYLPWFLAPWKGKAERHYQTKSTLRKENFRRGLGSKGWNISKHLKETIERDGTEMPLSELSFELGTIIDAALDGTTDSLIWFIVACLTQTNSKNADNFICKAQHELDTVIGHSRLPTHTDKPDLPYITAIVEEVLRWRPVAPEGVPHVNSAEKSYAGYRIPKGR